MEVVRGRALLNQNDAANSTAIRLLSQNSLEQVGDADRFGGAL